MGDADDDVIVLATPVRDAAGRICAAIDLSGPSIRLAPRLTEVAGTVQRAAAELTEKLSAADALQSSLQTTAYRRDCNAPRPHLRLDECYNCDNHRP
jgi:hypothetical protein